MTSSLRWPGCCHIRLPDQNTCGICAEIDQPTRPEHEVELDADGWHTGATLDHDAEVNT